MSKSISFQHGTKLSREHNVRNSKYMDKHEHIDKARKNENKDAEYINNHEL